MTVRDAINSALDEEMARDDKVFCIGEEVRGNGMHRQPQTANCLWGQVHRFIRQRDHAAHYRETCAPPTFTHQPAPSMPCYPGLDTHLRQRLCSRAMQQREHGTLPNVAY